jgi:hypothetical protein
MLLTLLCRFRTEIMFNPSWVTDCKLYMKLKSCMYKTQLLDAHMEVSETTIQFVSMQLKSTVRLAT